MDPKISKSSRKTQKRFKTVFPTIFYMNTLKKFFWPTPFLWKTAFLRFFTFGVFFSRCPTNNFFSRHSIFNCPGKKMCMDDGSRHWRSVFVPENSYKRDISILGSPSTRFLTKLLKNHRNFAQNRPKTSSRGFFYARNTILKEFFHFDHSLTLYWHFGVPQKGQKSKISQISCII